MKKLLSMMLCLFLFTPVLAQEAAPTLQIHQINLGFADGYFIRLGNLDILIDGGDPNPREPTDDLLDFLKAIGVQTLDAYIITHWHLDHCANLNDVLAIYGDENTVVYGPSPSLYRDYQPLAAGQYRQMKMGDEVSLGDVLFTCIGPQTLKQNGACNEDSLNFVLQYGDFRMLFTGDFAAGPCITGAYRELCSNVDVLKFPHHAMKPYEIGTPSSRVVNPRYVVVPAAASKHDVWNFFDNMLVKLPVSNIYTSGDGHFVILTDGVNIEVQTQIDPADFAPQAAQ